MTILRSHAGVLTKRVDAGPGGWRITPFYAGTWFRVYTLEVSSFGELLPGADPRRRRQLSDRAEHGEAVAFTPCARRWLGIDGRA